MLHTIYITHHLSRKLYDEIYIKIQQKSKSHKFYPEQNTYVSNYLKLEGFSRIVLRRTNFWDRNGRKILKYSIEAQLNPKRLIEKDNHITVFNEKDIIEVCQKFNLLISELNPKLNNFFNWILNRIDYAVNYQTDYVKEYIKLFQRADKPSDFFKEISRNGHRTQLNGSFYLFTKHVTINFYDKENQSIYNKEDEKIVSDSKGILRFEVQCSKGKTNYIKYSKEFKTKELYYFLNVNLARETIRGYYLKTIGEGDYYTLSKATKIINSQEDMTSKTKEKLIEILKMINTKRSIWKAKETFINNRLFNTYLKRVRKCGINPVTIPRDWNIEYLKNPLAQILEQMLNQ